MSLFNSKVGPDVLPIQPELDIHSALSAGIKFIHEGRSHDSGPILKDKHSPVTGGLAWHYSQGRNVLRRATKSHTCSILQAHFIGFTSSEARCGHPAVPVNSRVSLSNPDLKQGTTATYTCDEGYELFGASILVCLPSGSWQGDIPFCARVRSASANLDIKMAAGNPTRLPLFFFCSNYTVLGLPADIVAGNATVVMHA
uniref:Sushi domain-containing protein n=1 Tax=Timema shepardi TaxID=629360 RepID=A0A7R9APR9_TIMSH|nr:unnamed protein product [Timema shepardi]